MDWNDILELKKGEEGERLNLEKAYEWVIHKMDYDDFRAFTTLKFFETRAGYPFSYEYMVKKEKDTPRAREDYLKYFMYKLVQNIGTPYVKLGGEE